MTGRTPWLVFLVAGCICVAIAAYSDTATFSDDVSIADEADVGGPLQVTGTIAGGGNITAAGDLIATDDVEAGDDLSVGDDAVVGDSLNVVGSIVVGSFPDSTDFKDDVSVGVDLKVDGEFQGAKMLLVFHNPVENRTTDVWLRSSGYLLTSATLGVPMPGSGSVTNIIGRSNIDSKTDTPTMDWEIYINGSEAVQLQDTVDGTGYREPVATYARGTYAFVAGDHISLNVNVTGTVQFDEPTCSVVIQMDD